MNIIQTAIPDVLIFEPCIIGDKRGYFFESFQQDVFEKAVGKIYFVQDNQSKSSYGVLRGLHFQRPPFSQSLLVHCIEGEVLVVAVDIRIGSPTYMDYFAVKLNEINQHHLWIPKGFAHGFLALSRKTYFAYESDKFNIPEYNGGIIWNDIAIGINWEIPEKDIRISEKDKKQPLLEEVNYFNYSDFRKEKIY